MYIRGVTREEERVTCIICLGWSSGKISLQRTQSAKDTYKQSRFLVEMILQKQHEVTENICKQSLDCSDKTYKDPNQPESAMRKLV